MKFYVIEFENGSVKYGYFANCREAFAYADSFGPEYTISDYDSEEDYENNL